MHQSSRGELGTLSIDGRQVGGFSHWEITTLISQVRKGRLKAGMLAQWRATARKFWMLEKVGAATMDATFYCFNGVAFTPVSLNKVRVKLPSEYPFDKAIPGPMEMTHG